jgi:predicted metalloendopeptidase
MLSKAIILKLVTATILFACISERIDPNGLITNFYKAVNKKWLNTHHIPDNKQSVSNFTQIQDIIDHHSNEIIVELKNSQTLSYEEQIVLNYYKSYMNIGLRDKLGFKPLQKEFETIENAKSHKDIANLFALFQTQSISTPFNFGVWIDKKDSDKYIVYGNQGGLSLSKDEYLKPFGKKTVELYQRLSQDILKMAQFKNSAQRVENIIELEVAIATIQWSNVESRNTQKTYNIFTFEEFESLMSSFDMKEFLQTLNIEKNTLFNIMQPSYFKEFNKLFRSTKIDVWKDYLRLHLIFHYGGYLTTQLNDRYVKYLQQRGLIKEQEALNQRVLNNLNKNLGMLFGKLYVQNFFSQTAKQKVVKLIQDIKDQYEIAIKSSKRLSDTAKKAALDKLYKMRFNIGYPDIWEDYSILELKENDIIFNTHAIAKFEHNKNVQKLFQPVDKNEWGMSPQSVNAYYNPQFNKFVILAGILNKPFFDHHASDDENYGGIGFIIAHEIGHAFDDQGSLFDADGNMKEWWSSEDHERFEILKKKLIDQANHYEVLPGKFENGPLGIGEIIADLSGAEIITKAYMKLIENQNIDKKEAMKKFFINMAKSWRAIYRPEMAKMIIDQDPHPLGEYRINGTLQNMQIFYDTFNIKPGDSMYLDSSKRVKVW